MSQLLSQIDVDLAREADPARRAVLLSRKAAYLARVGSFEESRALITGLRNDYGDGSSPRVSVWIMLAEGLLHTFERLAPEGLDRLVRAEALAAAMRDRQLMAWTASWRAHWQLERSEFVGMTRSLHTALANADASDHEPLARVAMVLANAYASCGNWERANVWYMASRDHALSAGDQATIEAFLYNRAAFGMAWLRAQACLGKIDADALNRVALEIASARNYQDLTRVAALTDFVHLWQARLDLLRGSFQAAIEGLGRVRDMRPSSPYSFDRSLADLEIAYCRAKLGEVDAALMLHSSSVRLNVTHLHEDEQMVVAWLQLQLALCDGRLASVDTASCDLKVAKQAYADVVGRIASSIRPFDSIEPPGAVSMRPRGKTACGN